MLFLNRPLVGINGTRRTRTYHFFWCRHCNKTIRIVSTISSTFICPFCYDLLFQELCPLRSSIFPSHNFVLFLSSSSASHAQLIDTISQINNISSSQPRPTSIIPPQESMLSIQHEPQTIENKTCSGITKFRMSSDILCFEQTCPICKEDFVVDEQITKLGCNHLYHSVCISPWLQINRTCPVCRYKLPTHQGCSQHDHNNRARRSSSSNNFRVLTQLFSFLWPFRLGSYLDRLFPS